MLLKAGDGSHELMGGPETSLDGADECPVTSLPSSLMAVKNAKHQRVALADNSAPSAWRMSDDALAHGARPVV